MDEPVPIYIVDDDTDLRRSLADLLRMRTSYSISTFNDGESWLDAEESLTPGCLLLDYSMPAMSGLKVLEEMRKRNALHRVIMLTGEGNISVAVQAMHAGAHNFIEKPVTFEILRGAIELAVRELGDAVADERTRASALEKIARLKPREHDVMMGLADGLPNKVIAHRLGLSVRTVEVYRANLMEKLEVKSLADVIKIVFGAGLAAG